MEPTGNAPAAVEQFLKDNPAVRLIIVQWVDICGVLRCRLVPTQRFVDLVRSGQGLNCSPLDVFLPTTEELVPDIFPLFCAKGAIVPDVQSLRPAAHDGGGIGNAATVMGEVVMPDLELDARANLRRRVRAAEEAHGMRFLMGFELEVCFLQPGGLEPAGPGRQGLGNASYTTRSDVWPVLNEVVVALAEAGIVIEQVIKEYGRSQWEVALPPLPPLESVDAYVYAKEVIKNVAHRHGMVATFSTNPAKEANGQKSGQHIHMSVAPVQEPGPAGWEPDAIMAGVLGRVPSLMAVGLSQMDSYTRVGVNRMCTGGLLGWGYNHRDMPIRRVAEDHWEVRTHDATSNPYAMAAGLIAAATDRKPLDMKCATSKLLHSRTAFAMLTPMQSLLPCTRTRRRLRWD
jgi:glutamine synthetase